MVATVHECRAARYALFLILWRSARLPPKKKPRGASGGANFSFFQKR
jgi:hypothetical protein